MSNPNNSNPNNPGNDFNFTTPVIEGVSPFPTTDMFEAEALSFTNPNVNQNENLVAMQPIDRVDPAQFYVEQLPPSQEVLELTKAKPAPAGISVGAYMWDGVAHVYADTANVYEAYGPQCKTAAYEYRKSLNMTAAGIESVDVSVVTPQTQPASRIVAPKVYRALFKLNQMG